MAFNPFNLFKGNPKVLQLLGKNEDIDVLLLQDAFVSQFKRTQNEGLAKYMDYYKYQQLIDYITVIDESKKEDKNRSFKYPFAAAEILSVNNELTQKFLLQETVFVEEQIVQETEVEKEVDSQSSDRSYSSINSINSSSSKHDKHEMKQFQQEDKENFVIRGNQDKTLEDILHEEKDICEDDFPDAKIKKTIMVKEMVKRTVKKPFEPLVFNLLGYFSNKEVIHILDGYVCKVLEGLITSNFTQFVTILEKYHKFSLLEGLFNHIDSTSVGQFLLNFICKVIQTDVVETQDVSWLIQKIQKICLMKLDEWKQSQLSREDRSYCLQLYALLTEKVTIKIKDKENDCKEGEQVNLEKQLFIMNKWESPQHIDSFLFVLSQLIDGKEKQWTYLLLGMIKILRNILNGSVLLKNIKTSAKVKKEDGKKMKEMVEKCEDAFDPLINMGFGFVFEDALLVDSSQLSTYKPSNSLLAKLELLQFIGHLVAENIYFSRRTTLDSPFFDHLFNLLDLYPNSSIFHNAIIKIITPFIVDDTDSSFINKFFQKRKLLSYIHQTIKNDEEIRYEKKGRPRVCFISHIVSVCMAIEKLNCQQSEELGKYKEGQEWQYIHSCLVEEKMVRKKVLGGMEKIHGKKAAIFFTKKECLNHFRYFLAGMKYNSFDQFENYEPGNSDSEDQNNDGQNYLSEDKIKQNFVPEIDEKKYFDEAIDL